MQISKAGHGRVEPKSHPALSLKHTPSFFLFSFLPPFLAAVHTPVYTASMHCFHRKEMPTYPSVLLESKLNGEKGAGNL